ncbi:MAG: aminotransferase class I/II-fold pyridoxal phosphate-dependent enzyme [Planctomycetes bacterium]|nr:aminotransferase class I/II-fold pyridoxal phosphate-dependent enzyme [Planctomycetota bacterium]
MAKKKAYKQTTRLVHGPSHSTKWDFTHHVTPPLSSSTTYRLDSARRGARGFQEFGHYVSDTGEAPIYIYDRLDEPTRSILEGELAEAEGGEACVTFASGMAAISAAMSSVLVPGDEIVAHPMVYGCTHSLFVNWYARQGIGVTRVDMNDVAAVRKAITARTRILYFESPVNPTLELIDIAALRKLANAVNAGRPAERKLLVYIDNTFATPFGQRPLEFGADVVLHSLTKNLGGFGTELGGAVICPRAMLPRLLLYRKDFGGILASKSAWSILVYGLPTLAVRIKRQQYTAGKVATWLEKHRAVKRVVYPGLESFPQRALARKQLVNFDGDFTPGNMLYFELDERRVDAERFVDQIAAEAYSVTLAVSLGHTKTLIEMPSSMTHSAYSSGEACAAKGATPGGIRLSIGLESPTDILRDLGAAFDALIEKPRARRTAASRN